MPVQVSPRQLKALKLGRTVRKPAAPKLKEADVVKQCVDYATYEGWFCIRLQSGLFYTKDGRRITVGRKSVTDWIFTHSVHGVAFIEFKRPGEKPSDEQFAFMHARRRDGFNTEWFDSLEDLKGWMGYQFGGRNET